jgi:hypothetical protein
MVEPFKELLSYRTAPDGPIYILEATRGVLLEHCLSGVFCNASFESRMAFAAACRPHAGHIVREAGILVKSVL